MRTLNVQAVITAVDRLTGPLNAMGGRIAAMQNRFNSAATSAAAFGTGAGMAAAGLIATVTSGQYDLDKALREFQVVGTATEKQRRDMGALADQVAVKLGMPQLEIIQGATELLQAGLEVGDLTQKGADGVTMLQNIGEAAKVAGVAIADMSKDLVVLAKSFEMPWATSPDRLASMQRLQGLAIVAPRLSPDSPAEHIRALGEFGAIAAQLSISPEEASALQSTLSSAGFTGSRGGMALKTILQRMLNPTPAAQAQMMAAGFNFGRVFKTDLSGLNADTFINALGMGGVHAERARSSIDRHIRKGLAQGDNLDLLRWKGELEDSISSSLGLKKGDAQNRRIIKKSIDNITATKQGGLDVIAFLEELQKMPVAAFKDLVGLHHATKGAVLKFQDSLRQYKSNLERIRDEAPGAIDEGLAVKLAGFSFQVDRLGAAWTFFKNALSTTGTFGAALDHISNALIGLGNMDPAHLDMLSKGITGLGLSLAGIAAASGGVWLLARLGAILTGPLGKWLAAGGLAILAGGLERQQFGANGAIQEGSSPLVELLEELVSTGGSVFGLLDDIAGAALRLVGVEIDGSTFIKGIKLMSALLRDVRESIEIIQGKGPPITNPNKEWGWGDLFKPFDADGYAKRKRGEPAEPEKPGERGFWDIFREFLFSQSTMGVGATSGSLTDPSSAVVQRLDSPLQVIMSEPPVAKLEGAGTVTVNVNVQGAGELTGVSAADDGKNIKLNTGGGMPDTNR